MTEIERLREALKTCREAILSPENSLSIVCTVWAPGPSETLIDFIDAALSTPPAAERGEIARPLDEWHEEIGPVLWWKFPVEEAPHVGSPLDCGHTVEVSVRAHGVDKMMRVLVGGWPGYHTHWTPLGPMPLPAPPSPRAPEGQ